jgi:predicted O-methyltransferase YrrM
MNAELRAFLRQLEEQGRTHDAQESEHARKFLNLDPETAEIVSIFARSINARHALEIGTSNGYSTIWLAASIGPEGGRVITIDRSAEKQAMARANLSHAGVLEYVDLRLGDATGVVKTLPGPFDFVLFDADRISAPEQVALLLPKLTHPALILADNALSHPDQIAGYLAMIEGIPQVQHVTVPIGRGLSVAFLP